MSGAREDTIKLLNYLHPKGELVESRIKGVKQKTSKYWEEFAGSKGMVSGWFKDREKLAELATKIDEDIKATAMYVTLHPCDDDMYAKSADCLTGSMPNTKDDDIKRLSNLLIDVDVKRKSGISSTDEEHKLALDKADEVMRYLSKLGWPEPLTGDSGNGAHLIYKIDMDKTDENVELVKSFLQTLAVKYNTDRLDIDTSVYNPENVNNKLEISNVVYVLNANTQSIDFVKFNLKFDAELKTEDNLKTLYLNDMNGTFHIAVN